MSTNRPPQLQLTLHTENGTSFKRSFEQFGFDLDTPSPSMGVGGNGEAGGSSSSGAGSGSGNERNKRARSQSTFLNGGETAESSGSSQIRATQSSPVHMEGDGLSGLSATRPNSFASNASNLPSVLAPLTGLLRIPSPEPQDIEMSVLEESQPSSTPAPPITSSLDPSESYRRSLERFNAFDSEISALRQTPSHSPSPLPTVTAIHDDEYNGVDLNLHPQGLNIPGLQMFLLGEFRMSEDGARSQLAVSRFDGGPPSFEMLDVDPVIPMPSLHQIDSRESFQPGISTLNHDSNMDNHSPVHGQLPSTLPRLSPSPLFSPEDMQRWSSQLSSDDTSPSRFRANMPPRATPDYMPPRDWFDTSLQREQSRGNSSLDTHSTASDRHSATSTGRETTLRRVTPESLDGESLVVDFPSIAHIARERQRGTFESLQSDLPFGSNEDRRRHPAPSSADWSLPERPDVPSVAPRQRYRLENSQARADQVHTENFQGEGVQRRPSGRRFRLPRIDTSDYHFSRPGFGHHSSPLGSPSRTSFDSTDSPNQAGLQRSSDLGDRTPTPNMFLRRPISPSNVNTFGRSSTNNSHLSRRGQSSGADSPDAAWLMPRTYPINESFRHPATVHPRLYSSRVDDASDSLVANAAELRRRRSQTLRNLDAGTGDHQELSDDDHWNTVETTDAPDVPLPHTGYPWTRHTHLHADDHTSESGDSALRYRSANPLIRASEMSASWSARENDDHDHVIHALDVLSPTSNSRYVRGIAPGRHARIPAGNANGDRTGLNVANFSQAAASLAFSPPRSLPVRDPVVREIPQHGRAFPSSIDTARGSSSARPTRAQSPVAWEDVVHSTEYTDIPGGAQAPRLTDLELRAQARFRRSSLVDAGLFQSPSPSPSPVERAPRRSVQPPRTMPPTPYGNLDLSAYHEGPFRASLQRFVDMDRIRTRLNRLESLANDVSSNPTPSSQQSPPITPPLRDHSHGHLSTEHTFRQTANPAHQPVSSSAIDPELRYSHLVREARLGRSTFPRTSNSQNAYSYSNSIDGNSIPREVNVRIAAGRLATRMETGHNTANNVQDTAAVPYSWEEENRTQRDRFNAYDARMQTHWNQTLSVDGPSNSRLTSPSLTRHAETDLQAQDARILNSRMHGIQARVRAHMAQTRVNTLGANNEEASDMEQTADILNADGPNTSTQRGSLQQHRINRYQVERNTDQERFSADNDIGEAGSRSWSARARYARRSRLYRPTQPVESATLISGSAITSARQHRSLSHSPSRRNSNVERSVATAAADRTARIRAARERVQRDREFMGDFPRHDPPNHTHRIVRNLGDYVRDEDFDPSYENLLSLASTLGEARPRATPGHIIAALPTASYKDWRTLDSDQRCPICLDDYKPLDAVLKLSDCSHWLHRGCLEQWLRNANTCPVCRKRVNGPTYQAPRHGSDQDPPPSGSNGNRHYHGGDTESIGFRSGTPPWRLWE